MPKDELDEELEGVDDIEDVEDSEETSSEEESEGEVTGASEVEAPVAKPKKAKKSSAKKAVKAEESDEETSDEDGSEEDDATEEVAVRPSKMQFGDLTVNPGPGLNTAKARNMLRAFAASPLVPTVLPIDYLNPHVKDIEFQMQGVVYVLPLGEPLMVPQIVEQFIRQTVYGRKR